MKTSSCLRPWFGAYLLALSAAAASQNAVTTHSVRVYAGPDDSYPTVARLDADVPVRVMGCLDDWSWCDVAFEDNRGWLYAPDLAYDYEGDSVPLYTYAPSLGIPVVQFTIGEYWDRYYHGRPWYAQRVEWEHRRPADHRRPPGPPPSAGPPPRSARADGRGPREDGKSRETQPERSLRLGSTEPSPEPRSAERKGPPPRDEHPADRPASRAEPPRHEEHAASPQRAEGARHEDMRQGEKPGEKPAERPGDAPRW